MDGRRKPEVVLMAFGACSTKRGKQMSAQNVSTVIEINKVSLIDQSHVSKPTADAGKVRLGGLGPVFQGYRGRW